MTSFATSIVSRLPRQVSVGRLVAAATALLVVIGIIAAFTDHFGLAITAVLLVQATLVALIIAQRQAFVPAEQNILRHVDESSARTLADLTRARHAILTAIDEDQQSR